MQACASGKVFRGSIIRLLPAFELPTFQWKNLQTCVFCTASQGIHTQIQLPAFFCSSNILAKTIPFTCVYLAYISPCPIVRFHYFTKEKIHIHKSIYIIDGNVFLQTFVVFTFLATTFFAICINLSQHTSHVYIFMR